jgi:hypothetical protein
MLLARTFVVRVADECRVVVVGWQAQQDALIEVAAV